MLKRGGYAVATAASGEEAWELFFSNPYPVVVTDLDMKNMSGMDLLQKIKQHHPDTQVIIMTNNASFDSVTMSLRCGAFDYLPKPFDLFNLFMPCVTRAMKKYDQIRENLLEINRLKEIEKIENANKLLKNLTIRDGLTGLFNYRYFQEDLAMSCSDPVASRELFPCCLSRWTVFGASLRNMAKQKQINYC